MVTRNHGPAPPRRRPNPRSSHDRNRHHHHPALTVETAALETVTFDIYRDIHKGIRAELFAVTHAAGRVDPHDAGAVAGVADPLARTSRACSSPTPTTRRTSCSR